MSQAQRSAANTVFQESAPSVLDQILDQVQTLSAQHGRPSPVHLRSWEEIERFAEKAARSGMVPRDYIGKPDAIVIAVMMGAELGLAPMQSLQNIAVVNGRPSVWGDALPALCRASGKVKQIKEWSSGEGDFLTFYCEAIRKDDPNPITGKFSVADAKKAGLWGKGGPWSQYPLRMGQMRARGFCLRDAFPDVLKGLISTEEAQDIPFEATGLTPRLEPVASVMGPPTQTSGVTVASRLDITDPEKWLDALTMDLANAQTGDEVDEILSAPDVQNATDKARGTLKDRLNHVVNEAIARTAQTETSAPNDLFADEPPAEVETPAPPPQTNQQLAAELLALIAACDTLAGLDAMAKDLSVIEKTKRLWAADKAIYKEVPIAATARKKELAEKPA